MTPIPGRPERLALYLGTWALVGGLLAVLLAGQAELTWTRALLVALPLGLAYSFICLSAWYVARSMPAKTTAAGRIAVSGIAAAAIIVAQYIHHGSDHRAHVGTILGAHGVAGPALDVWAYGRSTGEVIPPPA